MRTLFATAFALCMIGLATPAHATPRIGEMAPGFTATDTNGKTISLSDFKGKNVVLEWTNNECPFVRKHYDSKNMQSTQKYAADNNAVWISIVSSAPEKQGHVTPEDANKIVINEGATITAKILDEKGEIGHLYDAKTTPHMFIIDKDGKLAYMGAIDSNSSPRPSSVTDATNYVKLALAELAAGKPVTTASTEPYGCSVKY